MIEVELSLSRLMKIWWYFLWRYLLFIALVRAVSAFIAGFVVAIVSINRDITNSLFIFLVGFAGIPISIWIIKNFINKRFSDFQIALISLGGPRGTL